MKRFAAAALSLALLCGAAACAAEAGRAPARNEADKTEKTAATAEKEAETMRMSLSGTEVQVEWEENEAVEALRALCADAPLEIAMSMYGGFEQVGGIGAELPRNDAQTKTQSGDIVLYSGDQIVVFYGENAWAYTRLGRIADKSPEEMAELLGNGDVVLTLWTEGR